MAGKIRALLTRPFQKGRDWYDILWYVSRIPPVEPDSLFLSNSLAQYSEVNYFKPELGWKGSIQAMLNRDLTVGRTATELATELAVPGNG